MRTGLCGCFYSVDQYAARQPLPQISSAAYTAILATSARTTLFQTFLNPTETINECIYQFPLYDGVSVVSFSCQIGLRVITGVVKEKTEATQIYEEAIERGETAGLLQQGPTSDVFSTTLGNIPTGEKILVKITYVGELKHDLGGNGIRFTLPTKISSRYGGTPLGLIINDLAPATEKRGVTITVDISMAEGSFIQGLRSPSHPIAVTIGNISTALSEAPRASQASATLSLESTHLDEDFVLEIIHQDTATPKALLETHPIIEHQRALMVTLVPQSILAPSKPEIIFIVDRSGSMRNKIPTLVSALKVFLKSLPVGIHFNICSFGSHHHLLWSQSRVYDQESLVEALLHVENFEANYGGTETMSAVKGAIESRRLDQDLSVILCTDGDIWQQQKLFTYIDKQVFESETFIRVFPLGIGNSVSHALIEGVARAGKGFAQAVGENEKLDSKVVRMLRGALTSQVTDYTIEVEYGVDKEDEEDYVLVERVADSLRIMLLDESTAPNAEKQMARLDAGAATEGPKGHEADGQSRYGHLRTVTAPKLMQTPHIIPPLYQFIRTTVYLLLSPAASRRTPTSVVLRGNSPKGPTEVKIPVEVLLQPGETLHQLAAKKAMNELEASRGWLTYAVDEGGMLIKDKYPDEFNNMVERESVRLGVQYQISGKWCSFVAIERDRVIAQHSPGSDDKINAEDNQQAHKCARLAGIKTTQMARRATEGQAPRQRMASQAAQETSSLFSASSSQPQQTGTLFSASDLASQQSNLIFDHSSSKPSRQSYRSQDPYPGQRQQFVPQSINRSHPQGGSNHFEINNVQQQSRNLFASLEQPQIHSQINQQKQSRQVADPLHQIISLQTFEGSWDLKPLLEIVGLSGDPVAANVPGDQTGEAAMEKVWGTILAIKYLELILMNEKDTWELVAEKAKGWLESVGMGDSGELSYSMFRQAHELVAAL